jgi:hypothetical protein
MATASRPSGNPSLYLENEEVPGGSPVPEVPGFWFKRSPKFWVLEFQDLGLAEEATFHFAATLL